MKIPFPDKSGPEKLRFLYELKFRTEFNTNMLNLMVMSTFPLLDQKHSFFGKFGPKMQICFFRVKFGT